MKIFLYKFVIILLGVFLLFEFTIGYRLKYYERNLKNIFAKQSIESIKQKAKDEMRDAINKDVYLDPEDAKLISQFIKKIQKELQASKAHFQPWAHYPTFAMSLTTLAFSLVQTSKYNANSHQQRFKSSKFTVNKIYLTIGS